MCGISYTVVRFLDDITTYNYVDRHYNIRNPTIMAREEFVQHSIYFQFPTTCSSKISLYMHQNVSYPCTICYDYIKNNHEIQKRYFILWELRNNQQNKKPTISSNRNENIFQNECKKMCNDNKKYCEIVWKL